MKLHPSLAPELNELFQLVATADDPSADRTARETARLALESRTVFDAAGFEWRIRGDSWQRRDRDGWQTSTPHLFHQRPPEDPWDLTNYPAYPKMHPQVAVSGQDFTVDENMVGIVEACWDMGLETAQCCQGGPPPSHHFVLAFLSFKESSSMSRFINIMHTAAARWEDEALAARIAQEPSLVAREGLDAWSVDGRIRFFDGEPRHEAVALFVRMSPEDLPAVERALREAVAAQA